MIDRQVVAILIQSLGFNLDDRGDRESVVMMLKAVRGSKSNAVHAIPIWTTPGSIAKKLSNGKRPRNHAKFECVDDRTLIVTSANFSWSAEEANVDLGLRTDDPATASMVLRQMEELEDVLYERV